MITNDEDLIEKVRLREFGVYHHDALFQEMVRKQHISYLAYYNPNLHYALWYDDYSEEQKRVINQMVLLDDAVAKVWYSKHLVGFAYSEDVKVLLKIAGIDVIDLRKVL